MPCLQECKVLSEQLPVHKEMQRRGYVKVERGKPGELVDELPDLPQWLMLYFIMN